VDIEQVQDFLDEFFVALLCNADAPLPERERAQEYLRKVGFTYSI